MKALKFIILIFLFSSCGNHSSDEKQKVNQKTEFNIPSSDYTIIEYKPKMRIFSNATLTDLNSSELIEIERILKTAILNNNERQNENIIKHNQNYPENKISETGFELKLGKYFRQYIPVINENGEKEIWMNFSCNTQENDRWKTGLLPPVMDGGNCYFSIKINLTKETYSDLKINGYA
jgi:hypothetical protein